MSFLKNFLFKISKIDRAYIYRHIGMAKYLFPSAILQWTSVNWSLLMASFLLSSVSVAILRVGQAFLSIANVLSQIMENILPRIFGNKLNNQVDKNSKLNYLRSIYILKHCIIFHDSNGFF